MSVVAIVLLCVVAGITLRKAGAFLSRPPASPIPNVGELNGSVAMISAVARCWLAPTTVMAVFVALGGGSVADWERLFVAIQTTDSFPHDLLTKQVLQAEQIEQLEKSDLQGNRPEWTEREDTTSGDVRRVVLASRLWSTEEEANQELRSRTAALVRSDFEQRHHGLLDPEGERFLSDDRAVDVAVKDKYIERVEQDFGKFTSPMNRVWWQVELSPLVRTEIYPAWKTAVAENRVVVIGTILAVLTLLANEAALFARLKRASNGRSSRAAIVTAGSIAAWIAADFFVASRLLS